MLRSMPPAINEDGNLVNTKETAKAAPVIIKKYANRRLYNTATSSYVTLDNLSQMVRGGADFVVYDAKTGEEITRAVLTQIIVEEEQKGQNLLPISFLRELIGFYGNNMQWLVPRYLEHAMKTFSRNQEQLSKSVGGSFGGLFPFGQFEEMGKQNMALFEQALKMFSPFGEQAGGEVPAAPQPAAPQAAPPAPAPDPNLRALHDLTERLNHMQKQLEALSRGKGDAAE
jgi:polyhydroxyalkanoate synthesis repressor PhaR